MTTFLLVRHCAVGALGQYLAGRAAGERLTQRGRSDARRLGERFSGVKLDAVFSSPLERALETAEALAGCAADGVQTDNDLLEIDFGEWTGKTFGELRDDPRWTAFNEHRSITRIPGGEIIGEVQTRAVSFIERLATRYPGGRVAAVTHGDVIRAAMCFYLDMPLDSMQRFDIDPGSVSVVEIRSDGPLVRCMNIHDFNARAWLGAGQDP